MTCLGESWAGAASALRECWARRSRTGVDACSWRAAVALDVLTEAALLARFALGMPRFSAKLVAIDDWGSLRRDVGAAGGEEAGAAVWVRAADDLDRADVVEWESCLEAAAAAAAASFFCLGGASLMRPASLRWWCSSRLRMRRACEGAASAGGACGWVPSHAMLYYTSALCVSWAALWKAAAARSCCCPAVATLLVRVAVAAERAWSWAWVR